VLESRVCGRRYTYGTLASEGVGVGYNPGCPMGPMLTCHAMTCTEEPTKTLRKPPENESTQEARSAQSDFSTGDPL